MTKTQPALAAPQIVRREAAGGAQVLSSEMPLKPYEDSLGLLLRRWARAAPLRTFLAERVPSGNPGARSEPERRGDDQWATLTWGEADRRATAIAQGLLNRGLRPARPPTILWVTRSITRCSRSAASWAACPSCRSRPRTR